MDPNKKTTEHADEEIISDGSADAFSETETPMPETDKEISDEELDDLLNDD